MADRFWKAGCGGLGKKKKEKAEKSGRKDKEEKLEKSGKKDREEKRERFGRKSKEEKAGKKDKTEKQGKPGMGVKPQKSEKAGKKDKADKLKKPGKSGTPEKKKAGPGVLQPGADTNVATAVFRALGDESRMRILLLLDKNELCATELLESVGVVQSTLSHHMKVLAEADIVACRREGKKVYYSIRKETMERVAGWLRREEAWK